MAPSCKILDMKKLATVHQYLFRVILMSNDLPQSKNIIFHYFVYVARYHLIKKKKKKKSKGSEGPPCHRDKVVKSGIFRWQ